MGSTPHHAPRRGEQSAHVASLKRRADTLQQEARGEGNPLKRSEALERVARESGFKDWNAAVASQPQNPAPAAVGETALDLIAKMVLMPPMEVDATRALLKASNAPTHGHHAEMVLVPGLAVLTAPTKPSDSGTYSGGRNMFTIEAKELALPSNYVLQRRQLNAAGQLHYVLERLSRRLVLRESSTEGRSFCILQAWEIPHEAQRAYFEFSPGFVQAISMLARLREVRLY